MAPTSTDPVSTTRPKRSTIRCNCMAKTSSPKSRLRVRAPARSREASAGSFATWTVLAFQASRVVQVNPDIPSATISGWAPFPITTGTHPAAIASTVVIPKCSNRIGSRFSSLPNPVACQKTVARSYRSASMSAGAST